MLWVIFFMAVSFLLVELTVTLKVTVNYREPDLNKNFLIHTGTKKFNALRGTTRLRLQVEG